MSAYTIEFKGLKEGSHEYNYHIGKTFFDEFENSLVDNGDLHIDVLLIKRSTFLELHLDLSGTVELTCDRCLDNYQQEIDGHSVVFFKFGEIGSNDNEEVMWLPNDEHQINVSQLLYEFIVVNIPLRHIHPGKKGQPNGCDPAMVKKIREYTVQNHKSSDERWDELKKLLNNN